MKLLVLHPSLSANDPLLVAFKVRGTAVLTASNAEEAMATLGLHGKSVDAAVVHREGAGGAGTDGLAFLTRLKQGDFRDLPVIMTSDVWSEEQFAMHQNSSEGVNAYLRWRDAPSQIDSVLTEVLGDRATGISGLNIRSLPVSGSSPAISLVTTSKAMMSNAMAVEDASPRLEIADHGRVITTSSFTLAIDEKFLDPEPVGIIPQDTSQPQTAPTQILAGLELTPTPETAALPEMEILPVSEPVQVQEPVAVFSIAPQLKSEPPPIPTDAAAEKELPYLFNKGASRREILPNPVGDAVVPGGAVQAPDVGTLKHYLELREKDVSALSIQLRDTRELLRRFEEDLKISHRLMDEQDSRIEAALEREKNFEREKALLTEGVQAELEQIRFELKTKNDKVRLLQAQINEEKQEMERLRERVRSDIRSIKSNERELQTKLEMTKSGFEALLSSREASIIELKRKLDLTEFNLDLVQDKLNREKERNEDLKAKLVRASQAVRVAGGLLDQPGPAVEGLSEAAGVVHGASNRKVS